MKSPNSGKKIAACEICPREPFGGGSRMFWGEIRFDSHTELVFIHQRSMNVQFYLENIIQNHVMFFGPCMGNHSISTQDNVRLYIARLVLCYSNEVEFRTGDREAQT